MSETPTGLYAKLAEAIAEVEHVAKDGTNEHFKYSYTSAEEIYRELRTPLLSRGLVFIPSVASVGDVNGLMSVRYKMRIIDAESGEVLEADWIGEGQDKGDKASYKAATGACKTFLRHLFMLPADDDPEADAGTTDAKPTRNSTLATTPATTKQLGAAKKALKASNLSDEAQKAIWVWGHGATVDGKPSLSKPRASEILDAAADGGLERLASKAGFTEFPPDDVPDETVPGDEERVPF